MVESVDTRDLSHVLSAPIGNEGSRTAQIRGKLTAEMSAHANPEPSRLRFSLPEGVETRRAAPKAGLRGDGEWIVQATNDALASAVKIVAGKKISRSYGHAGSSPAVRTTKIYLH